MPESAVLLVTWGYVSVAGSFVYFYLGREAALCRSEDRGWESHRSGLYSQFYLLLCVTLDKSLSLCILPPA